MKRGRALTEQIGIVERRLEIRRERTVQHIQQADAEIKSRIQNGMKWAPLGVVGALGAAAFVVGRRRRANGASEPSARVNGGGPVNRTGPGALATVAALADIVVRIALAPEVRELWRSDSSRRSSPNHRNPAQ
jgi:hypothetical protein